MATPDDNSESFASKYPILKNWKTIVISCLASMFEFYDFGVLGFFTKEIGQALLPSDLTEMEYRIWGYALFSAGFFTRPFGGALFGYIGDNYGRKKAFRLSIITMAICTFSTGCLPTYETIGIFAPLLLLFLRLIQGLSTGGEITSVFVYLYEIAPKHRRAFWMSLMVISSVGAFLATIIKIIINHTLTSEEINSWGWRIPFWIGISLLFLGWWSKHELKRTPIFEQMIRIEHERDRNVDDGDDNDDINNNDSDFTLSRYMRHEREDNSQYQILPKNPFTITCCHNFPVCITLIFATALNHIIPYMFNIFLPDYLHSVPMHGWSDSKSYQFNAYLMMTGSVVIVIVGIYTDKYGPLRFLICSAVLTLLICPFVWYGFTLTVEPFQDFLLALILTIIPNITCGACYFWYIDALLLDPRTRTRIFGVAYNIGAVLFAGTAPFLGAFFIKSNGITMGSILIGSWVSLVALLSLIAYIYGYYAIPQFYLNKKTQMSLIVNHEEQQELTANDVSNDA